MSKDNDANGKPRPGTMEAIRAALAEEAKALTDTRVLQPTHVWLVVAMALPEIDLIVEAARGRGKDPKGKSVYDRIAEKLRKLSGFDELSGESVRQYRSRIKGGKYDAQLARLGLRRVGNRIEPLDSAPGQTPADPVENQSPVVVQQLLARPNPPEPNTALAPQNYDTTVRIKPDPE
jgi:hypothetical protein